MLVGRRQRGFDDTREVEHGGPLAFAMGLPDDVSVQQHCDFGRREIAVEVEVLCVGGLVLAAEVDPIGGRFPFGRKDEGNVVASGIGCGALDLDRKSTRLNSSHRR